MSKLWFYPANQANHCKPVLPSKQPCRPSQTPSSLRFLPGLCPCFQCARAEAKKKVEASCRLAKHRAAWCSLVGSNRLVDWEECVHIWRLSGWPLPLTQTPSHPTPPSTLPLQTSSG
ncbi:hypothetical protein CGRA01v4_05586 [Colletotrichum graminicola]|nr:hypothetical protein CGRA01v4_05586 [Colletotrichum graminicola]